MELEIVTRFIYLGIAISLSGSFSLAQKTLASQAQKAIFSTKRILRKFAVINPLIKRELFDKLITPILCYDCEVWGFHTGTALEKVHHSFLRQVLEVKTTTVGVKLPQLTSLSAINVNH